ncbi:MAG TPA: response regulator [Desulfobacteraceae bacterium]|nr:response regulator [Desulfobacteraceae bacterium]
MSKPLEVLLLDDEPIVGRRLKPALDKIGCSVEVFEDPAKAVERMDQKAFHIVVTDIRMEGMDGLQVLGHVQQNYPQTKVIMITGYAKIDLAREAMGKGVFDFIAKPFKPEDLRQIIFNAAEALGVPMACPSSGNRPVETSKPQGSFDPSTR